MNISSPIVKFLAVSCLLDALQAYGNAVLRTIGAQSYCMIISFVCYYVLGLPVGFALLFKTKLRVLGSKKFMIIKSEKFWILINRFFKVFGLVIRQSR